MKMPEIRKELFAIARKLHKLEHREESERILFLVSEMVRRSSIKKSKPTSRKIDDGLVAEIREFAKRNPAMSQVAIAAQFGVNQGRISEVLRGYRT